MNFDMSNQSNSGLLRFRSAPSSVLHGYTNEIGKIRGLNDDRLSQNFQDLQGEVDNKPDLVNGYSLNSQLPPHYPRQGTTPSSMDSTSSYNRVVSSTMAMENLGHQSKMASSGLLRQNSSPAGLFTHLNPQNGYGGIRCTLGNYNVGNIGVSNELSPSSRLKGQIGGFSSGVTSLGMLSRISEVEPETGEPSVLNDASDYFGSWEHESSQFTENFTGLKRELDDDDGKLYAGSQGGEIGNHPTTMLAHHLSLPKTTGEMAAVEKLLHFQDSVPCKVRAKRGCATHPRSIAERVRRTRISERMRKLQDLVPNMDKQTNTADMLDLAVDYIKDLQKQYKTLSDSTANCRCGAKSRSK